jgi:hypothetical protein
MCQQAQFLLHLSLPGIDLTIDVLAGRFAASGVEYGFLRRRKTFITWVAREHSVVALRLFVLVVLRQACGK